MKTVKVKYLNKIPANYTGIFEWTNGTKNWFKNGELHREDGPARIYPDKDKEWHLNGHYIFGSNWNKINLSKFIILSKEPHPLYPTCQVWKYIDQYGIKEQIVIPGMEAWITE